MLPVHGDTTTQHTKTGDTAVTSVKRTLNVCSLSRHTEDGLMGQLLQLLRIILYKIHLHGWLPKEETSSPPSTWQPSGQEPCPCQGKRMTGKWQLLIDEHNSLLMKVPMRHNYSETGTICHRPMRLYSTWEIPTTFDEMENFYNHHRCLIFACINYTSMPIK